MIRLLLLAVVIATPASGQVAVRLTSGVDGHRLGDLRGVQEASLAYARQSLGVPAEATEAFPPFPALRADLVFLVDPDLHVGLEVGTGSTGGRVDYQDRTGLYRYDLVASRVYAGAYSEWVMRRTARAALTSTLRYRYSLSRVDLAEDLVVLGETLSDRDVQHRQLAYSVQPEVALDIRVGGPLSVRVHAGWEQVLVLSEMDVDVGEGVLWPSFFRGPRSVNWSGPRLGVGLSLGR